MALPSNRAGDVTSAPESSGAGLGSAVGVRIIGHVAQSLVALLDWDMAPQAAVTKQSKRDYLGALARALG